MPHFRPHDFRHRRISLWHDHDDPGERPGLSWAEVGKRVGQRNISVTADRYTHALVDPREIDREKLLERVRAVHHPVLPRDAENAALAGTF